MFLNTRNMPEFQGLNYKQRMQAMHLAQSQLPLGKKALLNSCKFLLLTPVFFLIAKEQSWSVLPWLILTFFVYPLVTKPLTLWFVRADLQQAVTTVVKADSGDSAS